MNSKILTLLSALLLCLMLAGCGEDPAIVKFENDIDAFCARAAEIDAAINAIDAESENASKELLAYLDELDQTFKVLSEISVPEKYAYMEQLTSEASSYMTTAVSAYHEAFANDSYNETTAKIMKGPANASRCFCSCCAEKRFPALRWKRFPSRSSYRFTWSRSDQTAAGTHIPFLPILSEVHPGSPRWS